MNGYIDKISNIQIQIKGYGKTKKKVKIISDINSMCFIQMFIQPSPTVIIFQQLRTFITLDIRSIIYLNKIRC